MWAKKRSKKHLIFEKWQHFQNGQNWPWCMGYSPCKMVSLGQKLKIRKRCEKRFYDHIKLVVCKKPLQKPPNIRKITALRRWLKLATMPMQNGQFGSKNKKWQKGAKNDCATTLNLLCAKNRSKKNLIFEKLQHFENGENCPYGWAIAHAKWSVWV